MHILNKHFDNIYVLHIDNEEKQKISPKLQKYGINVEFFEGVNGYKCPERYNNYLRTFDKNNPDARMLNCGSFGHILSFIKILSDAKRKKYKKILVLEPDVYFCKGFENRCKRYLSMDYKILYFGASQNRFYKEPTWDIIDQNQSEQLKNGWYRPYKTLGTFAIAFDRSILENCLEILRPLEAPTDVSLIKVQTRFKDKCLVTYPNLICCDLTKSKTSAIKEQLKSMRELRWNLDYDLIDEKVFKTEIGCWYELEITLNSYMRNFVLTVIDNNHNKIYPNIQYKDMDCFSRGNKMFICFKSKTNSSILLTKNIFPSNYTIRKASINYAKMRMPPSTIYKIKDDALKNFYIKEFGINGKETRRVVIPMFRRR